MRDYDAGKKVKERNRHILVDMMGLLLMVVVHMANIQDRDGAKQVLEKVKAIFSRLILIWADGGYAGQLVNWVKAGCGWILEIVKCSNDIKGFQVLPHRWVVERIFGWLGRYRRLSKDYEGLPESSESIIFAAMIHLMVKRLGRMNLQANERKYSGRLLGCLILKCMTILVIQISLLKWTNL